MDGHVEAVAASSLTPGFFGPSMNPAVVVSQPTWFGQLDDGNMPARDTAQTLYKTCADLDVTKLLYTSTGTTMTVEPAGTPSWWSTMATYTQASGTRTVYDWNGVRWNGANRIPICGDGDGRTGTATITITPNVTAATSKKVVVTYSAWDSLGSSMAVLGNVQIGSTVYTMDKTLPSRGGCVAAGLFAIPVKPGQNIIITLNYSAIGGWSGMNLAFEN
jgi:hypothetical protein